VIDLPSGGRLNLTSGHCDPPAIQVWAGFRSHILIPHDVVGTLIDDKPTGWTVFTKQGNTYLRHGKPFLRVVKHTHPNRVRVVATALTNIWIQEPELAVKIAGEGTWRGIGPNWITERYSLRQKDAHRSTVHFNRIPSSREYVQTIRYDGADGSCLTLWSDGGYTKLLRDQPAGRVPYLGAQVFDSPARITGAVGDDNQQPLQRWELAGCAPPRCAQVLGQMYFGGWGGGAGAVVNVDGRTPPDEPKLYDKLWQPRSWRLLREGQSIAQTLVVTAS
jgi:hypothetical protein